MGATERLSILYARAENSPETRDSDPDSFSKRIDMVCCLDNKPLSSYDYYLNEIEEKFTSAKLITVFNKNDIKTDVSTSELEKFNPIEINFGKIVTELKKLKKKNFDSIIMIGGLTKPKLNEIKPDINSLKLIPMFAKKIIEGGDNNLLTFCIKTIEDIGFKIINIKDVLPELFLGKGVFTKISPGNDIISDIKKDKKY